MSGLKPSSAKATSAEQAIIVTGGQHHVVLASPEDTIRFLLPEQHALLRTVCNVPWALWMSSIMSSEMRQLVTKAQQAMKAFVVGVAEQHAQRLGPGIVDGDLLAFDSALAVAATEIGERAARQQRPFPCLPVDRIERTRLRIRHAHRRSARLH